KIENILFAETTTLGIRKTKLTRKILKRKKIKFESSYGTVTLKIAYKNDKILKFSPEYEECKKIAHNTDTPLQKIYKNIIREGKDFLKNNN
ncbi:MAG TPA: nickel insertion protein, partial [Candidatus Mcinerneyibacterium sp.]|nr:nickel insertion protein [Candidatus Mcinerneyibacterium sp.]